MFVGLFSSYSLLRHVHSYLHVPELWFRPHQGVYRTHDRDSASVPTQLWLMESPRWLLLSSGRREEAVAALTRARGRYGGDAAAVEAEVDAISDSLSAAQSGDGSESAFLLHTLEWWLQVRCMSAGSREAKQIGGC